MVLKTQEEDGESGLPQACAGGLSCLLVETWNPVMTVSLPCGRSGGHTVWCLPFCGGGGGRLVRARVCARRGRHTRCVFELKTPSAPQPLPRVLPGPAGDHRLLVIVLSALLCPHDSGQKPWWSRLRPE